MSKFRIPKHVWFWDDERDLDHGIVVTLRDGWSFEPQRAGILHVKGFDTIAEAQEAVKAKNLFRVKETSCQ